ncbi:MAG: ExbD/TolR family protein [Myxococcota bacterium]
MMRPDLADDSAGPGLAPLIDVVLLLLIFFMVTTRFSEHSLEIDLPEASTSAPQDEPRILSVDVLADGRIEIDGAVLEKSALDARLAAEQAEIEALSIRADEKAPHGVVVTVLDLARRNGIERVELGANPE